MAIIISAFPGMGKSYIAKHTVFKIEDADSSKWHWLPTEEGSTPVENPNFIEDYMKHISDAYDSSEYDFILVSSHSTIRKELDARSIKYYLIYPYYGDKRYWIDLYKKRGNSERFVENINAHYCEYIEAMDRSKFPFKVKLQPGQFLDDKILTDIKEGNLSRYPDTSMKQYTDEVLASKNVDWDIQSIFGKVTKNNIDRFPWNPDYIEKYQKLSPVLKNKVKNLKRKNKR